MPELRIRVEESGDGAAVVGWDGDVDLDTLIDRLSGAADRALEPGGGLRRLELSVPASDGIARRAALRSGFRLEGVRREAMVHLDGTVGDVMVFGRLDRDVSSGPDGFSGVMNSALPKKRVIAHVLMRDESGRILLCETQFKTDWELPGGIVEPREPPRHGAVREVREELGLDLEVGRLLVADWMPPYLGWDDALELIFDGGLVTQQQLQAYVLQPSEILRVRLCTLEEASELVTPLSHRRLVVAAGLTPPATVYLENGAFPEPLI